MIRTSLIVLALSAAGGVANAATLVVGTVTDPSQIDGVVVNGTTYDVTLSAFNAATPPVSPFSTVDTVAAGAATVSLAEAFNGLGITGINGTSMSATETLNLLINLQLATGSTTRGSFDEIQGNPSNTGLYGLVPDGPWVDTHVTNLNTNSLSSAGSAVEYATFTAAPVPVPLPAAAWLLLSGLGGLGGIIRRRVAA
jgi:hypothetical protein